MARLFLLVWLLCLGSVLVTARFSPLHVAQQQSLLDSGKHSSPQKSFRNSSEDSFWNSPDTSLGNSFSPDDDQSWPSLESLTLETLWRDSEAYEEFVEGLKKYTGNGTDGLRMHVPRKRSPDQIEFRLYTRKSKYKHERLRSRFPPSLKTSFFNASNPTVVIIHGFMENVDTSKWMALYRTEYFVPMGYNVILVQWTKLAGKFNGWTPWDIYIPVVANVPFVGAEVAKLLNMMKKHGGLSLDDVHIIGFSLGAHVAGIAGRTAPGVGRITAIDPAGPMFHNPKNPKRITKNDAKFVDVLHCNTELYGLEDAVGHVDIYVNSGKKQPWCEPLKDISGCSHMTAPYVFADTLRPNVKAVAHMCENYTRYENFSCFSNQTNYMGYSALSSRPGIFFIDTLPYIYHGYTVLGIPYHTELTLDVTKDMIRSGGYIMLRFYKQDTNLLVGESYIISEKPVCFMYKCSMMHRSSTPLPLSQEIIPKLDVRLLHVGTFDAKKPLVARTIFIFDPVKKRCLEGLDVTMPLNKEVSITVTDSPCPDDY